MYIDFDKEIDRRGTNSYKWDSRQDIPDDTIPLWVADMDFRTARPIIDALVDKAKHGIFGYTYVPQSYYESICSWFARRHKWTISPESIIYTSGVVPAISAIIKALTVPGDKVLVCTPVYNCFFSSIRNNGCIPSESPLRLDGNRYYIDFDDLEAKASDSLCKVMLLCNPHNPAGRVWTREELTCIAEICARHDVVVVSDEIHCEIVFQPYVYTPYALVDGSDKWVACISPTKAFNIAGLQIANIVAPNSDIRARIDRAININEVCDVNQMGVVALQAAYNDSESWLESLLPYIYDNYKLLRDRFVQELPQFPVIDLEATYLAWVDCRCIEMSSEDMEEYLIKESRVWLNAGKMYGADGEGFMRINLACPRHRLQTALDRLIPVLKNLLTE